MKEDLDQLRGSGSLLRNPIMWLLIILLFNQAVVYIVAFDVRTIRIDQLKYSAVMTSQVMDNTDRLDDSERLLQDSQKRLQDVEQRLQELNGRTKQ